ncbi:MmgE/PrpD family protein [Planococcus shenhongbingii]|uniref:MmgE/PrpD family protein n=1 Tax=Planococcus shenhongbingii TaxID=3058398 RepID=A0ABT8NAR8_9BACL|nr:MULTISPECIES: MmgE/PrpD family protein [unclassified Planococcus (in: firmicutes)]MDN7244982.1 MmgE/PrpD family protein [Planococcus sp. N017]WKA58081.1 MmgE/PrpD family protein [Planococcus sp. N016]
MELSKKLAEYSLGLTYEKLPAEVVEFTKLCILDYFGSAIAGSEKVPVQMISELAKEMGGAEQAHLVTGGRSSILNAALVNGAASHVMELDDIHKGSIIHAATVVIPAALAVAEWKEISGKELIAAVVAGYEVCFRIGEAVSPSHYYYWHNTATCGTFGAAIAAAKLLDLTVEQTIAALGNAGTQAAGLWEFIEDGAMTKQLHTGKAAMNGLLAALLAQKGFTGPQKILEGNRGFFKAMSEEYDVSRITEGLGEEFKIMENSFKIHASCRHTHHAVDLLIDIFNERHPALEEIESVTVQSYQVALNITDNDNPKTQYAAKFSLQFCSALALLKGSATLDDFSDSMLWNEEIRQLLKKVKVVTDPQIDASYPKQWGAAVEVRLANGETVRKQTDFPKGDPENAVTAQELRDKFLNMTSKYPEQKRQQIADDLLELEKVENIEKVMVTL